MSKGDWAQETSMAGSGVRTPERCAHGRDWAAGLCRECGPDEWDARLVEKGKELALRGRCDCILDGSPIRTTTVYIHECQWHAEQGLRLIAQAQAASEKDRTDLKRTCHTLTQEAKARQRAQQQAEARAQAAEKHANEAIDLTEVAQGRAAEAIALAEEAASRWEAAAAAIERVRANWPHIEIPATAFQQAHGLRRQDPGSPACLRCRIEELLA